MKSALMGNGGGLCDMSWHSLGPGFGCDIMTSKTGKRILHFLVTQKFTEKNSIAVSIWWFLFAFDRSLLDHLLQLSLACVALIEVAEQLLAKVPARQGQQRWISMFFILVDWQSWLKHYIKPVGTSQLQIMDQLGIAVFDEKRCSAPRPALRCHLCWWYAHD